MKKSVVFIAHIPAEKKIAIALKELVEAQFLNMMEVFVSSSPKSLTAGDRWFDRITTALKECAIEIVIASPASVKRPWINFECGAGYIRDIPVIPVCHSGMTPPNLPEPLNQLQAVIATEESELQLMLLPVLAKAIGSGVPEVDFSDFIAAVRAFEETSNQIEELFSESPVVTVDGLREHEMVTLIAVAESGGAPNDSVSTHSIIEKLENEGFRPLATKLGMAALERLEFIEMSVEQDGYAEYSSVKVTPLGWEFLSTNQDKLNLRQPPKALMEKMIAKNLYEQPNDDVPF